MFLFEKFSLFLYFFFQGFGKSSFPNFFLLQIRELEEAIERVLHRDDRSYTLSDERWVWILHVSEDLQISRYDRERSFQLVPCIVDEVMHGIEIVIDWFQRLAYEVSAHEIKRQKYEEIEREKADNITDDVVDRIASLSEKYRKCSSSCIGYFSHDDTILFESRIWRHASHDTQVDEFVTVFTSDRTSHIDDISTRINDESIHTDTRFSPLFSGSTMSYRVDFFLEVLFLIHSLRVHPATDEESFEQHEKQKSSPHKKSSEATLGSKKRRIF